MSVETPKLLPKELCWSIFGHDCSRPSRCAKDVQLDVVNEIRRLQEQLGTAKEEDKAAMFQQIDHLASLLDQSKASRACRGRPRLSLLCPHVSL